MVPRDRRDVTPWVVLEPTAGGKRIHGGGFSALSELMKQSELAMRELEDTLAVPLVHPNNTAATRRRVPRAALPGPGSYEPSVDLTRRRAPVAMLLPKHRASRARETTPGPGSYDCNGATKRGVSRKVHMSMRGSQAARWTAATPQADNQEAAELGPGKYNPNHATVEPTIRGGTIPRASDADLAEARGKLLEMQGQRAALQGTGASTEALDQSIAALAVKIERAQITQRSKRVPGPAKYSPHETPVRRRRRTSTIAPGQRWAEDRHRAESAKLGPGCYEPDDSVSSHIERSPVFDFGTSPTPQRQASFKFDREAEEVPGPGSYFDKLSSSVDDVRTVLFRSPSRQMSLVEPSTPGPGQYNADDRVVRRRSPAAMLTGRSVRVTCTDEERNTVTEEIVDMGALMNYMKARVPGVNFGSGRPGKLLPNSGSSIGKFR